MRLSTTAYFYQAKPKNDTFLVMRMKEIANTRVHYGFNRVHVMLKREGFKDNHKRVYRLYRQEGLSLRHKRPKGHKAAQLGQTKTQANCANQIWSMDFVADNLFDGRKIRMLTVVDCFTRESLAIHVGQSLKGEDVAQVLSQICSERGVPMTIKTDNGSEFISKALDKWAYERGIEQDFSRPGKPTDNAMIESFNGRLRQECLNQHWFMSLEDAKSKIGGWRQYYNESRPHSALDWQAPAEFAAKMGLKPHLCSTLQPENSTLDRY